MITLHHQLHHQKSGQRSAISKVCERIYLLSIGSITRIGTEYERSMVTLSYFTLQRRSDIQDYLLGIPRPLPLNALCAAPGGKPLCGPWGA